MKESISPYSDTAGSGAVRRLEIGAEHAGQRIDNFLFTQLKGVPKSRIYKILRKGEVRVNKGRVKPEYKLCAGDQLRIPPLRVAGREATPQPGAGLLQALDRAILYEDERLLVIDKPVGLAVHGGSGIAIGLIEALRKLRADTKTLELVHRLDRDTSGCLMVAKNRTTLRYLQQQMQEGQVGKIYQALVVGRWPKGLTQIAAPLQKNQLQSGERVVRVSEQGKRAVTHFTVLRQFPDASLLEARLETGRTHQIRVHCQSAGHGLAGDEKYGDETFNRQIKARGLRRMFLHATQLHFALPGDGKITVSSSLPEELLAVLRHLEGV